MTAFKLLLIGLGAIVLAGCLNFEQETFLNKDLSGVTTIDIFANQQAIKAAMENPRVALGLKTGKGDQFTEALFAISKMLAQDSGFTAKFDVVLHDTDLLSIFNEAAIKSRVFRTEKKDGVTHNVYTIEFTDIRELYTGLRRISISDDPQGKVLYSERWGISSERDAAAHASSAAAWPLMSLGYFKYTLHMPDDIVYANTADVRKNTAVWKVSILDAFSPDSVAVSVILKPKNAFLRWIDKASRSNAL